MYLFTIQAYTYLYYTPNLIFNNKILFQNIKIIGKSLGNLILKYGFNSKIYLFEKIKNIKYEIHKNPQLIDIIISNHISSLDFIIITTYLEKLKVDNYNYVLKSSINYIPGLGIITYMNSDIKLNRKWEEDQELLNVQLDVIINNINNNKQVIIIFPEGTRSNKKKLIEGQYFSINNNLPVYNNLLVPKTKGLFHIINYLKEKKKLGQIWDISLVINNLNTKLNLFNKLTNIFIIVKELTINNDNILNQENFKKYFLNYWTKKDIILSNYNKIKYNELNINNNYLHYIQITIIILLYLLSLYNMYSKYYLLISIIICYIFIIFKIKL
jgi:1-acyl-sn-glycerol-3-phosphate acyltransferase